MGWTIHRLRPRRRISYSENDTSPPETPKKSLHDQIIKKNHEKNEISSEIITKETILKNAIEINSRISFDDLVQKMLIELIEHFVESVVNGASLISKHRKGRTIEKKDVQLYLRFYDNEKNYLHRQKFIPTKAHKERMALINKFEMHYK